MGRGWSILKNDCIETQKWLQTESWILEVCKFMSANQINISHLAQELLTHLTHDAYLITQLASEGDSTTSELQAINRCCMSKGILFISNISNHQGTHLQQSATDKSTNFNMVHDLNWHRKNHTMTEEWRKWEKSMRTLCNEIKQKLRKLLVKFSLDDKKYKTSWHWFLSRDLHTLFYREHETWHKYKRTPISVLRHIEFHTITKSKYQCSFCPQVFRIILTSITSTHLQIEATRMEFLLDPTGPPLY